MTCAVGCHVHIFSSLNPQSNALTWTSLPSFYTWEMLKHTEQSTHSNNSKRASNGHRTQLDEAKMANSVTI